MICLIFINFWFHYVAFLDTRMHYKFILLNVSEDALKTF